MRNLPATVVSTMLQGPLDWPDATVVSGDAVDVVARLKEESEPDIPTGLMAAMVTRLADHLLIRRSFDELTVLEPRAGADQRDQVGALTARQRAWADSMSLKAIATPAARDPGSLRDPGAEPDGGEGRLDWVVAVWAGGSSARRVVVARGQYVAVVDDLATALGHFARTRSRRWGRT